MNPTRLLSIGIAILAVPSICHSAEVLSESNDWLPTVTNSEQGDDEFAFNAVKQGKQALTLGDYPKAQTSFEQALTDIEIESSPLSWLTVALNLCHTLTLQGRNTEAIDLIKKAVETCEARLGADDPSVNEALGRLASLLKKNDRLDEAEAVYRRNLSLLERKFGPNSLFVSKAVTRLADLLQTLGKLDEAETLHQKAYNTIAASAGNDSRDCCLVITNLAECLLARGKKEEATALMEKAFNIVRSTDDENLPSIGLVLRKQAEFYRHLSALDRAEELGRRALIRLASRNDSDRAKFFYYDKVTTVYRTILHDQGLADMDIDLAIRHLESQGTP